MSAGVAFAEVWYTEVWGACRTLSWRAFASGKGPSKGGGQGLIKRFLRKMHGWGLDTGLYRWFELL